MRKRKEITAILVIVLSVLCFAGFRFWQSRHSENAAPEISFDSKIAEVSVKSAQTELLSGVTATDAEDGDVSASLVIEGYSRLMSDGMVRVTYAAFDSDNHVSRAEQTVRFTDYTPPRFTLDRPLILREGEVDNISLLVGAADCIDGDLGGRVKVTAADGLAVSKAGEHEVEFRVTNSLGDTVYLPVRLEVVSGAYNAAQITLSDYIVYLPQGADFDAKSYVVSYVRGGETIQGADSGISADSDVVTDTPGTYEVTYECSSGGAVSKTRLIVVVEEGAEANG